MSWESLDWRPADAETLQGTAALADLVPMARSAADEAVSAMIMQPITTTALSVASAIGGDLPAGFVSAASFELLGTPRRGVWVALDPALGSQLGGTQVTPGGLATAIIGALDEVLDAIVGEGLSAGPADAIELDATADLLLLRLSLTDPDGAEVAIVTAVDAAVPIELVTHVVTLQAMGPAAPRAPSPASPSPASPALDSRVPGGGDAGSPRPAAQPSIAPVAAPAGAATREAPAANIRPFVLEDLPPTSVAPSTQNIELLMGVSLQVTVEIGRTRLAIRDVLALMPGSIVELDKLAGEKVDVLVNGQPIAQGEVVVVDENFGVRITDVVSRQRRILSTDSAA